jgi:hypothetical protein
MDAFPLKQSSKGMDAGSAKTGRRRRRRESRAVLIDAGRRPKRLLIVVDGEGEVKRRARE